MDLLWHSVCPLPVLVGVILLVAAAILWSLIVGIHSPGRIAGIGMLRLLMLLVLLVMLFQPQQREEEITILRPQIAVLVDGSESMTDPVDDKQLPRFQRVVEWFHSQSMEHAKRDFDLRIFKFDRSLNEQFGNVSEWKFNGAQSFIVDAVNHVQERFRGQPLAGILLLSDGIDNSGSDSTRSVSTNIPVMTFELEKPFIRKEQVRKISISGVDYPPRVVVGRETEIRISLMGVGMEGQAVTVELWKDGKMQAGTPVAFNEEEQTRSASFSVTQEKPGIVQYEVRVNNPAADKEARNYPFIIQAMEPGNRVIYLQNALGFDFKFLRRAIVTDRNLQLSTFVRLPEGRIAMLDGTGGQAAAGLDFSPQSLGNCSVVIIGDLSPGSLSPRNAEALRDFVNHGGGLVLLGGTEFFTSKELANGPLGPLIPVTLPAQYEEGKFPVRMTDLGLHHPVFGPLFSKVGDFPPLLSVNEATGVSPSAEVLVQAVAGGSPKPLVVTMRFGQGRVVAVLSNTLWRWRLASLGREASQSPYDAFWTQLMDWLIPKEQEKHDGNRLELFTERSNYVTGERPEVRAIIRTPDSSVELPATLPLRVRTPDMKNFDYTLKSSSLTMPDGKSVRGYRVEVDPNIPGVFVAESSVSFRGEKIAGETRFVVGKPPTEVTGKPINRGLLKTISEASGGRFYNMENWNSWCGDLHFKEQKFSRIQLRDLWNSPYLLGLFLILLCIEWIIRKLWNLP